MSGKLFRKMLKAAVFGAAFFAMTITAHADGVVRSGYNKTPEGPNMTGWVELGNGGYMYRKNGEFVKDGWENVSDHWYLFDAEGNMLRGWQTVDGKMYYLAEVTVENHPEGSCYMDTTTPDGRQVDASGAFVYDPNPLTDGIIRANPYGEQTCVEVDLTGQRVYAYQGRFLVWSAPCVTGASWGGRATPAGDYKVYNKVPGKTLRGYNPDGTLNYASYVNFWMPFNRNIGLHDATWRSSFGGSIYVNNGSHGCVNLPYDKAAALYNIVYVGIPVHVHH